MTIISRTLSAGHQPETSKAMGHELILLEEGYGHDSLHLGQASTQVVEVFGQPERRRHGLSHDRVYWLYPNQGFDCVVSTRSKKVLSLFFFGVGVDNHSAANVRTQSGIEPGELEENVLRIHGKPSRKGGGFTLTSGEQVRSWISYPSGLGFHLGRDRKVDIISIFAKQRQG